MKTIDLNFFLERYLSNEMDQSEKMWFEKELEGNAVLKKELELRRRTESVLRDLDIMDLRAKLNAIEKERSEESSWTAARRRMLKYAAVAAIILIAGTSVWLPSRKLSNDVLFQRFYDDGGSVVNMATRSASEVYNVSYQEAVNAYNKGEFEVAIRHFEDITVNNINIDKGLQMGIEMMKGNSLIEISKYGEAGRSYKKVVDNNDNLYIEDATWLLGLCYLKTDENDKAREIMATISKSASRYKGSSETILRRMK